MKVEEIERLLAEFYEGNTNEQEEELLKEAFRTEEVPEHLQKDKKLFLSFFPGKVVDNVPAGLEDMRPPTPQDTFSDPEAAYKALQATLIEVSANLNKGIEQIEETRIDVTKVNQEVRKEIQQ